MVRFLIYFQYIGTRYRGLARNQTRKGVLNVLEYALECLAPLEINNLTASCQTDVGVHALTNTAHVDLERPGFKVPILPETLVRAVNHYLWEEDIRYRVFKAVVVPEAFHARHSAIRRDYLYRVALGCKDSIPVFERERCLGIWDKSLDITKMQEASRLFIGLKNFASFRNLRGDFKDLYPEREMYWISVYHPSCNQEDQLWHCYPNQMLHIEFAARSYLYRQVRRLVGVLLNVGRGRLTVAEVDEMLRSRDNTNMMGTVPAPARGLYLKDVIYDEKDLRIGDDYSDNG